MRSVYRRGAGHVQCWSHDESQSRHLREGLLARSPDWQGIQRTPHQRTVAALRTLGEVDPGPLPHPLHSARLRSGRWIGRLAEQVATLAQGACLTPVGQEAHMPQALEAVGHDMEQKTPDKLMGLQRHGLHAIALAPIAIREAHAAVAHLQEAMIGDRDAMGIASQRVEHLGLAQRTGAWRRPPTPGIELVEQVGEAGGGAARADSWAQAQGLCVVGLL